MKKAWLKLKQGWKRWKPFLSPFLLGIICVFLGRALYTHWKEISAVQISAMGWACLAIATGITLFAHVWTGWVWGWILQDLDQPVSCVWAAQAYLKTNIAKYLPSNLLHLYGRAIAAKDQGVPLSLASLSVLLDTLLMTAGGLILGLFCIPKDWLFMTLLGVTGILVVLHPRILDPVLNRLSASLRQTVAGAESHLLPKQLVRRYPTRALLGETVFVALRGLGFVMTVSALTPISLGMVPTLVSIFSVGWVLGFITPGAPGGIGIFEVTVSTLLTQQGLFPDAPGFSIGVAITAVAIQRLVSTLAEALGAILTWADERWPLSA
ncbi:MAG: lysylphosphatidylglycerol synthase domain-containing protein [Thermosynechococcaceae cyanobacterium MS004]|nr:lysylphosphatidylglycerol synthase domain-containing protein [Thermosynechococcaceae cyanobacterium MS004]